MCRFAGLLFLQIARAKGIIKKVRKTGISIVHQAKNDQKKDPIEREATEVTLLSKLSHNADQFGLSDDEIYQSTIAFVSAGMDTTSSTMHSMAAYLATHPGKILTRSVVDLEHRSKHLRLGICAAVQDKCFWELKESGLFTEGYHSHFESSRSLERLPSALDIDRHLKGIFNESLSEEAIYHKLKDLTYLSCVSLHPPF